ncbi:MAG: hypothetical protein KGI08_10085 [Thaumarchaeota archaeon]|nr:hypothetical protein [Nitrososphaerota archaeon]
MSAGAPTTTAPVAAPPGGFQNGGWYGGEEYNASNNTFGAPGVINNPNQVGYGAAVSTPVNLQSDAAQGKAPGTIQNFLAGPAAANPGQQGGTTGNATTPTGSATPTSPDITASQGKISDIRNQITTRQQAASDAIAQINDNPFYSEATRVGKIAKVNENLNADLAPLSQQLTSEQANYDA